VFGVVGTYYKKEHAEGPSKIYVRDGQDGRCRPIICSTDAG
jgi:hypothetical protein